MTREEKKGTEFQIFRLNVKAISLNSILVLGLLRPMNLVPVSSIFGVFRHVGTSCSNLAPVPLD